MEKVKCPNMCHNGLVKCTDSTRALFSMVTCNCCRGKGVVNENDYQILNSKI